MKTTLLLLVSCLIYIQQSFCKNNNNTINAIIGNESLHNQIQNYLCVNENTRIAIHLKYVEKLLRYKSVEGLNTIERNNRFKMLDLLHNYWVASIFPINEKYTNSRRPCFIDNNGSICAVGFLIEKTAGRKIAEYINKKFQYNYINEMEDVILDNWIANSGLSKLECAMIQPSYFPAPQIDNNYVLNKKMAISTGILSGLNFTSIIANATQLNSKNLKKASPIIGIIGGVSQLIYGIDKYPNIQTSWSGVNFMNNAEKNVSLINIGLGSTSILLSTWNLINHKKQKDKKITWSLYRTPRINNSVAFGFKLQKKLG
jgi:hypothetical protein